MFTKLSKLILTFLFITSIILVLVSAKQNDDLDKTCSKDDELCKYAAKESSVKEKAESTDKVSSSGSGADTSSKAKAETKSSKNTETKEKIKKSKPKKEEKEIADCPLCAYTRPLVKHIIDWIKSILTDPMLIMLFDMFKEKVWELGHITKELIGFRLF